MAKNIRKRKPKYTDPSRAARRHLRREVKKAEKKIKKMLRYNEEGRVRAAGTKKVRDVDGNVIQELPIKRLQGFSKDSVGHKRMQSHIQRLQNRLKELGAK